MSDPVSAAFFATPRVLTARLRDALVRRFNGQLVATDRVTDAQRAVCQETVTQRAEAPRVGQALEMLEQSIAHHVAGHARYLYGLQTALSARQSGDVMLYALEATYALGTVAPVPVAPEVGALLRVAFDKKIHDELNGRVTRVAAAMTGEYWAEFSRRVSGILMATAFGTEAKKIADTLVDLCKINATDMVFFEVAGDDVKPAEWTLKARVATSRTADQCRE